MRNSEASTMEPLQSDEVVARIASLPKAMRTEAAMADEVLDFAVQLPENSIAFGRLKAKLRSLEVKVTEWNKVVKQHRANMEQAQVKASIAASADIAQKDERPQIVINKLEEYEVNEAVIAALARLPDVYQRFGSLVRVIESSEPVCGTDEKVLVRKIHAIPQGLLRDLFTRAVAWRQEQENRETGEPILVRAHPPEWSVKAVYEWQSWPYIRPLHHITEIPVLFHDGSLLSTPGYDEARGILYQPRVTMPMIPEAPSEAEIQAAKETLLDVVAEFPFEKDAHRSAWLAALLTPIARWAFEGQSPLFMFDANQAGSGKGLLIRVIGLVVLGHHMDLMTSTDNEEEERKRITAKLLAGTTMVVIDNIGSTFGSQVLEALITTGIWSERLLGSNEAPRLNAKITWYGSGNNVQYAREDTRRRVCTIRILTNLERPEERSGYKYDDLEAHIKTHRGELLAAALTILRGWLRTGKRASELHGWGGPWGSFDGWDQVVRGAIVYAGLPDPIAVKATNGTTDIIDSGIRALMEGLEEATAQIDRSGVTAAQIIEAMVENDEWRRADRRIPVRLKKLRTAFSILLPKLPQGKLPSHNQLGSLLGRCAMKPKGGKRIMARTLKGENYWFVGLVPDPNDIEREAIMAEGCGVRSEIGANGRCTVCSSYPHKPCGRCTKCLPEFGGCPCKACIDGTAGHYFQTAACSLCGKRDCRCRRCGECQNIGLAKGGCCC